MGWGAPKVKEVEMSRRDHEQGREDRERSLKRDMVERIIKPSDYKPPDDAEQKGDYDDGWKDGGPSNTR